MPAKRANDVVHHPVEWRGVTLTQWLGTTRTASLRGGNPRDNQPSLQLTVKFLEGVPITYDATVSMGQVSCSVYSFADAHSALDEAADRIHRLDQWFTDNKE